jgi:putative hydrolase of the HAD superfamily
VNETKEISTVLFDYGGVLASEGFEKGLQALARRFGIDPQNLAAAGAEAVYDSGYVTGDASETQFWSLLTARTGLPAYRPEFTAEILDRFVLRPNLLAAADRLRQAGYRLAILSDQTDWLDRLNQRDLFFGHFDQVFNSYHLGKGKRDASLFLDIASRLQVRPEQLLFIDDNPGHIRRAAGLGLITHLFVDQESCLRFLQQQTGVVFPA